ncbi:Arabinose 5-phosphate isomerase KpsF [Pseudobythopirellula maris]|uniref:Arabinose 5-phosphate isomerase KpsF n=1 Tax=Pseudobythopirellula maris TaxID=2527991 RepID=A0A5C5ZQW4_9BACT|nr:KpsF/GutQ family sugar-phosphate isomerase [Pseudobythopirellula maris]TWT89670.1 Arabinose 5-phosphate isomerase KpsF [Pseudobythopirellula maris]
MSQSAAASSLGPSDPLPMSPDEALRAAREVVRVEAVALWKMSNELGESFADAVAHVYRCRGSVVITGMGKAGLIGQKIAATFASTGTKSHFLHPAEAFHGDLGRVGPGDLVLMLSQSGETGEVVQLLPSLAEIGATIIAITAHGESAVGRAAACVVPLGQLDEACSLGLAPSTSTTAMLALGDALALVVSKMRGFRAEDFARFHPGGALGRKLSKVEDAMRPLDECRVASETQSVREVIVECGRPGRRTGAVMLTDAEGKLTGLFTDSDLARLFERRAENALDGPVSELMVREPTTVSIGARVAEAVRLLADRKFSELPVVDNEGRPLGLVDVTDIVGWQGEVSAQPAAKPAGESRVRIFPGEDVFAAG